MKTLFSLLVFVLFGLNSYTQVPYKEMMKSNQYNFYEIVDAAELYFQTNPKGKGTGWKPYQRWKYLNESKYFPSGDRSLTDPYLVEKAYERIINEQTINTSFFGGDWVDLGPYRIDSLTGHYSAGLGRIEHFYISPSNPKLIYIGSRSGGFWRSSDEGLTWENTTDFLVTSGVNSITASPTNSDSILINVRNSRNGTTQGIYRSINGGTTWTQTKFNPTVLNWGGLGSSSKIFTIAYHPRIPNLIFIGTSNGIFRSDDNLQTWTRLINSGDIIDIDFHPVLDSVIYLYDDYYWGSFQNNVLISSDLGNSYSTSNLIAGNNDARGYISISPDCSSCVYFASSNGIWKSTDNGQNFTALNTNLNQSCRGFAVNDLDTSKILYGYLDVEHSNNSGLTFNKVSKWSNGSRANINKGDYIHADLRHAECINGVYYTATDGLLSKSDNNCVSWKVLSQGTGIRENYSLGVSQSNHYRTISGSQDNGTSIKHKTTWLEFYGADGMEGIIHPLNDNWMIGSVQNGIRRRTKTGGITQSGITPSGQSGSWIAPLIYDPNNHMTVYHFGDVIYKSVAFGSNWVNIGTPNFSGTISEAAIAQKNSNIIVVSKGSNIEKSVNGGQSFTSIKSNLPSYTITDIAFSPTNDNLIIVTYARFQDDSKKIYKSTNQGITWKNITHNLRDMPIRKVVIDHYDNVYLGAEIGIYTMPLNGTSWSLYNSGLPNMAIEDMEVMWGTNTIRAATWGRGVWEYALVGREDYPAITNTYITDTPTDIAPTSYSDQFITSKISYQSNITSCFVKWSTNNLNFDNSIQMTNTIDTTWVSNSPILGQISGTNVYFKVFAVGSNNDTTETYKFMYVAKYKCNSKGNMSDNMSITKVKIANIDNSSTKFQDYTDYTKNLNINLVLGEKYDLNVNVNTDGAFVLYTKAWIDWSRNGLYNNSGEEYDLGVSLNTNNTATSKSPVQINVPSIAQIGESTMRVSTRQTTRPNPCDNGFNGEVEEYKITVIPPQLNFELLNSIACSGDSLHVNYTGNRMDSILWSFSKGASIYESNKLNDYISILDSGSYNLTLTGYLFNKIYTLDSINILKIHRIDTTYIFDTICQNENYQLGLQNITEPGIYSEDFVTPLCDSTVVLNLHTFPLNSVVTQDNYTLAASYSSTPTFYQWINCSDLSEILGANNQSYEAIENGSYAVIVSDNNCIDTSICHTISGLIVSSNQQTIFSVFPNPTPNKIYLNFENYFTPTIIKIHNNLGQLVFSKNYSPENQLIIDMSSYSNGNYYVSVSAEGIEKTVEIIKQ